MGVRGRGKITMLKPDDAQKIVEVICRELPDVVSVIFFGSATKEEKPNDIDLLIVQEKADKKRIRRIEDIAKIKDLVDIEAPLDIILVSKKECEVNFLNHNPLYLEIALDGKILFDKGFLSKLILKTKEILKSSGIRREGSSWYFPVKERIPSHLSEITNKEWAEFWIDDAQRDLLSAKALLMEGIYEKCVSHCQQAVEKVVKSVLVCWGIFEKTHYVGKILKRESEKRDLGEWTNWLKNLAKISEQLEPHISLSRYPEISSKRIWLPFKEYNHALAEEFVDKDAESVKTSRDFLKWWFKEL